MAEKQTEIKLPERPSQSRKQLPNFDVAVPSPPLTKGPLSLSLVDLSLASLSLCTAHNSECFRALCHRDKSRTRNEKLIGGRSGGRIIRASLFVFPGKIVFILVYLKFIARSLLFPIFSYLGYLGD